MWLWMAICSAFLLGFYDVFKKKASQNNGVLSVLLFATGISTVCFMPLILSSLFGWGLADGTLLTMGHGEPTDHLWLVLKSTIVTISWITGLLGLKHLPITTASTMKATRPVFILLGGILIFGEKLNLNQWIGIVTSIVALYLLGRSSRKEGIVFSNNKWVWLMGVSIISGAASAMIDKNIMKWMTPMFAQSWSNFYITVILAATTGICSLARGSLLEKFHWDWYIFLIALFLTISDFLYFFALSVEGSMISVVSMLRRSAVIVTFLCGVIFFKERRIREKALALAILLTGMAILVFGSR